MAITKVWPQLAVSFDIRNVVNPLIPPSYYMMMLINDFIDTIVISAHRPVEWKRTYCPVAVGCEPANLRTTAKNVLVAFRYIYILPNS